MLPERGRFFLEGFEAEMLRSDTGFLQLEDHGREIKPYMDRVLEKDHRKYVGFPREQRNFGGEV